MREPLTYDNPNHPRFTEPGHRIHSYGWFYNRLLNFTLGATAKCGTASIKQFIWMNEQEEEFFPIKDKNVGGNVYFVVRYPLDRFCSLWRSKCRDSGRSLHRDALKEMSPNELMDYIESGVKDAHWNPQVDLLNEHDAKLIPLELLGFWWKQSGLGELGNFNTSEGDVEIDDKLMKRILTYYADDLELYHKAQRDFCWATVIPNSHL
jgi:hypothetical protein